MSLNPEKLTTELKHHTLSPWVPRPCPVPCALQQCPGLTLDLKVSRDLRRSAGNGHVQDELAVSKRRDIQDELLATNIRTILGFLFPSFFYAFVQILLDFHFHSKSTKQSQAKTPSTTIVIIAFIFKKKWCAYGICLMLCVCEGGFKGPGCMYV